MENRNLEKALDIVSKLITSLTFQYMSIIMDYMSVQERTTGCLAIRMKNCVKNLALR